MWWASMLAPPVPGLHRQLINFTGPYFPCQQENAAFGPHILGYLWFLPSACKTDQATARKKVDTSCYLLATYLPHVEETPDAQEEVGMILKHLCFFPQCLLRAFFPSQ